ncbi:MAG: hypothetical protein ACOCPX_07760, partial [Halapricum sp.]
MPEDAVAQRKKATESSAPVDCLRVSTSTLDYVDREQIVDRFVVEIAGVPRDERCTGVAGSGCMEKVGKSKRDPCFWRSVRSWAASEATS